VTSIEANRFNAIVVLDSIPPDQLQSARRLAENIEAIGAAYPPAVSVERIRIGGLEDFFAAFDRLRARTSVDGFMPLLHFECHGSEDGFELSDGSCIEWAKLKEPLTQLNIVTGLNLMVCVAACTGGALLKVVTALDRAPLWGLIGPSEAMGAGALEDAYAAFYDALVRTKNARVAIDALDAASAPHVFMRITAQRIFLEAWQRYKDITGDTALRKRAKRVRKRLIDDSRNPPNVKTVMRQMRALEPQLFERYKESFFLQDLYPENAGRFDIRYPG